MCYKFWLSHLTSLQMLDYNVPGGVDKYIIHIFTWLPTFKNPTRFSWSMYNTGFLTHFNDFLLINVYWLTGKLNRGLSVIDSYKYLKEGKELTEEEIFLTSALGWCIEWVWMFCTTFFFRLGLFKNWNENFNRNEMVNFCSFKHIFLFLTISWITLLHVVVNPAGSEYQRCEVKLTCFCFWSIYRKSMLLSLSLVLAARIF